MCCLVPFLKISTSPSPISFWCCCSICDFTLSLLPASCSRLASPQFLPEWLIIPKCRSGHGCPSRGPSSPPGIEAIWHWLLFLLLSPLLSSPLIQTLAVPWKYCVLFHFQAVTLAALFMACSAYLSLSSLGSASSSFCLNTDIPGFPESSPG